MSHAMAWCIPLLLGLATLVHPSHPLVAPRLAPRASPQPEWWRKAVIYQIYPRSFKDGCSPACTGIGTLDGVRQQIPYLKALGVQALWLSPIFESPMADFGYDISNFTKIWPSFGTMSDFSALVTEAHAAGLRILLDFVPNHSSDQHPWFLDSASSMTSSHSDWYIWRDGRVDNVTGAKLPPNNWKTIFCKDESCSAWSYSATRDQWYYHCFLSEQPDLNWRNADVISAMHDVLRFWLGKGVDGFRMDAFAYMLEDDRFLDEPLNPNFDPNDHNVSDQYNRLTHVYTENQAGLHQILRDIRGVLSEFGDDKVIVGEIYADNVITESDVMSYYGTQNAPELSMPFNMNLIGFFQKSASPRDAKLLTSTITHYLSLVPNWAQPNFVLGNHDQHRIASRLDDVSLARLAYMLLLTLPGTPTIYNGDEFGQQDGYVPPGQRQDPTCKVSYTSTQCRDPERTPLQWDKSNIHANFTNATTTPWLPVSSDYVNTNVADQLKSPTSFLVMMRKLLMLRNAHGSLNIGHFAVMNVVTNGTDVFAFNRTEAKDDNGDGMADDVTFVFANLATVPAHVSLSCGDSQHVWAQVLLMSSSRTVSSDSFDMCQSTVVLQASEAVLMLRTGDPPVSSADKSRAWVWILMLTVITLISLGLVILWKRRQSRYMRLQQNLNDLSGYNHAV